MGKELSDMSLEELWELFPIYLVAHSDRWRLYYAEMEAFLKASLSDLTVVRISHVGSTAIPGIWAKDIVDILVEIAEGPDMEEAAREVEKCGFCRMSTAADRASFQCGYTKNGFADRVFHLHLRYAGDHDELYFRDYLQEHPQIAKEYEALKLRLWKLYEHNRDAYTDAKTAFIGRWTAEAKRAYAGRYEDAARRQLF